MAGSRFDDENELYNKILIRTVFAYLNIAVCLVAAFLSPPPAVTLILIGINVLLFSWSQYYRIFLILLRKTSCHEGRALSVRKESYCSHVYGVPPLFANYYVANFELANGKVVPLCIDNFTRLRIDNYKDAVLVWYEYPKGRRYGEIFIK